MQFRKKWFNSALLLIISMRIFESMLDISDKYKIRQLRLNDTESLLKLIDINRIRISSYLPKTAKAVSDKRSAKNYIKEKLKNAAEKKEFCFVIEHTISNELCGAVFLKNFEWSVGKCELGYFIDKDFEGQGIISSALKEISTYCFDCLQLNKLFIRSAIDNIGSRTVAEKNGFVEEGILRNDFMTEKGELIDVVYYGLIKGTSR
jgi:ribosomal-protein-serine acetyltransferase